jgi:hypothetical protein
MQLRRVGGERSLVRKSSIELFRKKNSLSITAKATAFLANFPHVTIDVTMVAITKFAPPFTARIFISTN